MTKAVIDRFEGQFAVLIIGDDEQKMDVPRQLMPDGAKEGDWLQVEVENGAIIKAELNNDETAKAKERIAAKLKLLRSGAHLKGKT